MPTIQAMPTETNRAARRQAITDLSELLIPLTGARTGLLAALRLEAIESTDAFEDDAICNMLNAIPLVALELKGIEAKLHELADRRETDKLATENARSLLADLSTLTITAETVASEVRNLEPLQLLPIREFARGLILALGNARPDAEPFDGNVY